MNTQLRRWAGLLVLASLQMLAWRLQGAEYGPFTPRNSNGKASMKVVLLGATPALGSELNAGKGLVIRNAATGADVGGLRFLQAKRKAGGEATQWFLKRPQECMIVYKPGKETVRITVWQELPEQVLIETRTSYMIIDVSGGPAAAAYAVTYQINAPPLDDEHKTTKIVLRAVPPGQFLMGSAVNELGRWEHETQHAVTLRQPFYIGIYEITQGQYYNVMGTMPAHFNRGAHAPRRPVERVTWHMARGGTWPGGAPDSTSFMGTLRSKTGLPFDLPTEAQWEYACRAGTTKALNNDTDLQSVNHDPNMDILGRYWHNGGSSHGSDPVNGGTAAVGTYLPNRWGLYDMHGNVWEWCLDWSGANTRARETDPVGPATGIHRVQRGGSWGSNAGDCRAAYRGKGTPSYEFSDAGFRLVVRAGR